MNFIKYLNYLILFFTFLLMFCFSCSKSTPNSNTITVEKIVYLNSSQKENDNGGGGIDSGGGNGLNYRLEKAIAFAMEALQLVKVEHFLNENQDVQKFYQSHYQELISEASQVKFILESPENFRILAEKNNIQVKYVHDVMITELRPFAPIHVVNNLNTVDYAELASNILHELGHHLGYPENADALLDLVAFKIIEQAKKNNSNFNNRITTCIDPKKFTMDIIGKWFGTVKYSWDKNLHPVEITFKEDGHYSSKSLCKGEDCQPVFDAGDDIDSKYKIFNLDQACGGMAEGTLDLFFKSTNTTTSGRLTLMHLKNDQNNQFLTFKYYHLSHPPMTFYLQRSI